MGFSSIAPTQTNSGACGGGAGADGTGGASFLHSQPRQGLTGHLQTLVYSKPATGTHAFYASNNAGQTCPGTTTQTQAPGWLEWVRAWHLTTTVWWGLIGALVLFMIIGSSADLLARRDRKKADEEQKNDAARAKAELGPESLGYAQFQNRAMIDRYHKITQDQAKAAFRQALISMLIGLGLLGVGVFVSAGQGSASAKWIASLIGAVSAGCATYLARTFLKVYASTQDQLNRYFAQPALKGFYLEAERLALQLPEEEKEKQLIRIIDETLKASRIAAEPPMGPTKRKRRKRHEQEVPRQRDSDPAGAGPASGS